ncbi:epithelial-stromal interaction protein 1 [Narcine bancroftii]|uniref:epithelial-stromal interaction protein 1 n=1 Tax=Narcine bancroftii TaxID=1343680 RepID=UPI003831C8FE
MNSVSSSSRCQSTTRYPISLAMSYNRRLYTDQLGRSSGVMPSSGWTDLTRQGADPRVSRDTWLEEANPGSDQSSTTQPDTRRTQYRNGYSMMTPNMTKRSQIQQIANKELEELRQWKEAHKPGPISVTPTQLGQKKGQDKKRKEAQELEYQKMKEIQREKANKLAERRRQEDQQRKAQQEALHYQSNQQFLDSIEASRCNSQSYLRPSFVDSTSAWAKSHTYRENQKMVEDRKLQKMKEDQRRKSEYLMEKESQLEAEQQKRLQEDHRRKNNAFLDKLERRQSGGNSQHVSPLLSDENGLGEEAREYISSTSYEEVQEGEEDFTDAQTSSPEGIDEDWDLMKLCTSFPRYHPTVLKEFLQKCDGDYARAVQLLQ